MVDLEFSEIVGKLDKWCSNGHRQSLGKPQAAVLIPILKKNDSTNIILTKRSSNLSKHSGQISFPGGKLENGEDVYHAALRETQEEIGINVDPSHIVGTFHDFSTPWYTCVTPVIAHLEGSMQYIPSASEIEKIFEVPIHDLMDETIHWTEVWERAGREHLVHFYKWKLNGDKYTIWGATAGVLFRLLNVLSSN